MSNEARAQQTTHEFRAEFGLGHAPISNMARLIEQTMNVGVAIVDVQDPGHGMMMKLGDRYLIAVGSTSHPMRLRSTLAHELGHFRLGSVDQALDHDQWVLRNDDEIQADGFARHLLVPLEGVELAASGRKATQALLSQLVQSYAASPSMVAIQLREVGAIDETTRRSWEAFPLEYWQLGSGGIMNTKR